MKKQINYWLLMLLGGFAITILNSCSSDTVEISKEEYNKLKGDTLKSKYPKIIYVPSNSDDNSESFEVWLGSDGHEYQSHIESHANDQWIHYPDCEKCLSRNKKDSL